MSSTVASAKSSPFLSSKELRELRARAHTLKPTVRIAGAGLSETVLRELDRTLDAHELIKIHAAVDDRAERAELLEALCRALGARPVQLIGKMLVAYRPKAVERVEEANSDDSRGRKRPAKRAMPATKSKRGPTSRSQPERRTPVATRRQTRKSAPRGKV